MTDFTESSQMRTNASGSPKTKKPNIIPKGQMTNQQPPAIIEIGGVKYQKIEYPKPETLYDALDPPHFTNGYMFNKQQKEWICNVVEKWMPNDDPHDGEEYQLGWNACLNYLRERLK